MPKIDAFLDGEMEEEIDVLGDLYHHNNEMFHCQIGSDRKPWPGQRFSNVGGNHIPSGKLTKNYGKSPLLMGKSTINGHFQ